MKLFMQGMRRSGTTIIFDILSQDERLDLYYEPLSEGKVGALGGGSGLQQTDLMEKIRGMRRRFIATLPAPVDPSYFNFGAPRDPELEFLTELPPECRDYLALMCAQSEHTVFKFTRMYRKVRELAGLAPDGKLLLLARHPQEVVASYMYGRDQRRLKKFPDREAFFTTVSNANPWRARLFFEHIIAEEGRDDLAGIPDWMRHLYLWKYTFDHTFRDGRTAFGEDLAIMRHEDLCADPVPVVRDVYALMGLPPDDGAVAWAKDNVRVIRKEVYEDDERWLEAYERLGVAESLQNAGYGPMRSSPTARGASEPGGQVSCA